MAISLLVNGVTRQLEALDDESTLEAVVMQLGLKADRIAIEHNGKIVPRKIWPQLPIHSDDRLEIVHFVGGGSERSDGVRNLCATSAKTERSQIVHATQPHSVNGPASK